MNHNAHSHYDNWKGTHFIPLGLCRHPDESVQLLKFIDKSWIATRKKIMSQSTATKCYKKKIFVAMFETKKKIKRKHWYCMIFDNIFSKYKEHYNLTDRILFRCSIENLGEFYGAKRQKFWILAARAGILYPSPDAQEFCTPPPMRRNSVPLPADVSGILYPSRQRCQEFCTPPVRSVRNSIPLPKNSIPTGSPK